MSTKNFQLSKLILERLLTSLDIKGFKKHGRVTKISRQTGYAIGLVSDSLAGKIDLSDRFLKEVCRENGISLHWVRTGEGEMFEKEQPGMIAELHEHDEYKKLSQEKKLAIDEIIKGTDDDALEIASSLRKRRRNPESP